MKKLFLGLGAIALLGVTSCKKEGCMDVDAENYDADAKKSATCSYKGSAVLWNNEASTNGMMSDGVNSLVYYVGGNLVGSSSSGVYFASQPDCGGLGAVSFSVDLGEEKAKTFPYKVLDQNDAVVWSGNIEIQANTCLGLELVY